MNDLLEKYSKIQIFNALHRFQIKYPTIFKWFVLWELEPSILMASSEDKIIEFWHYHDNYIYNILDQFKLEYPASYKSFFLYELEKPYSPFDRELFIELTEEDLDLLKQKPAPLKLLVPVKIKDDDYECG